MGRVVAKISESVGQECEVCLLGVKQEWLRCLVYQLLGRPRRGALLGQVVDCNATEYGYNEGGNGPNYHVSQVHDASPEGSVVPRIACLTAARATATVALDEDFTASAIPDYQTVMLPLLQLATQDMVRVVRAADGRANSDVTVRTALLAALGL